MAYSVYADRDTKEKILEERYRGRADKYLSDLLKKSKEKENDEKVRKCLEKVYHDIEAEFRGRNTCDYWIKPKSNEDTGRRYADSKGLLQCGIIHGTPNPMQDCKQKKKGDKVPHEINPCRTYFERALLELFELDHE